MRYTQSSAIAIVAFYAAQNRGPSNLDCGAPSLQTLEARAGVNTTFNFSIFEASR